MKEAIVALTAVIIAAAILLGMDKRREAEVSQCYADGAQCRKDLRKADTALGACFYPLDVAEKQRALYAERERAMSSSIILDPLERSRYFRDRDGVLATSKAEDDDLRVVLDLTDYLASGETVSSASYADSGVTTSSKSVATPQVLFTVTGTGYTTVTVTMSTGRTVDRIVRFYDSGGAKAMDYR